MTAVGDRAIKWVQCYLDDVWPDLVREPDGGTILLTHLFEAFTPNRFPQMIREYAKENDFIIVTKDKDFLEQSSLMGHPPKIIHLRLGNCSVQEIVDLLADQSGQIKAFDKQMSRSYMLLP